jgi:hypothetical protein
MSSLPISAASAAALPEVTFGSHHHGGHGARVDSESLLSAGQPGELPAGVGQGLMSDVFQALQQLLPVQISAAAPAVVPTPHPLMQAQYQITNNSGPIRALDPVGGHLNVRA